MWDLLVWVGAPVLLFLMTRGKAFRPQQLRCGRCGRTRSAASAGILRLGAYPPQKEIRAFCTGCGETVRVFLEPIPD